MKTAILLVAGVALLLVLVPPWRISFSTPGMSPTHDPKGHRFILSPPAKDVPSDVRFSVGVDYGRLALELAGLAIVAGAYFAVTASAAAPRRRSSAVSAP